MAIDASFQNAVNAYNNVGKISSGSAGNAGSVSGVETSGFSNVIGNAIGDSISTVQSAENTVAKSLVKQADITDVVMALTNAELTVRTVVQVRDKLVSALQEIMRMPI